MELLLYTFRVIIFIIPTFSLHSVFFFVFCRAASFFFRSSFSYSRPTRSRWLSLYTSSISTCCCYLAIASGRKNAAARLLTGLLLCLRSDKRKEREKNSCNSSLACFENDLEHTTVQAAAADGMMGKIFIYYIGRASESQEG
jgi:hypothetical protein